MTVTNLVAKWSAWGPQLQSLLRIESERHLASLERGEPMPTLAAPIPPKRRSTPLPWIRQIILEAGPSRHFESMDQTNVMIITQLGDEMRTMLIILGGFVLWGICLGIAKLLSNFSALSTTVATASFVAIWFVAAAANMWIGVSQAGYSFQEELPIFLLIFLLPATVAVVVKWKFL